MKRRAFMGVTGAALVAYPGLAGATGGLDDQGSSSAHDMRVLLASGAFSDATPLEGWRFAWNDRTYRGSFEVVALAGGRSGLVNRLPLDAYLYGVLSKEVSALWAPAAQQAQAIVSRTYALGKLRPEKSYDIVASESDQQYGGIESETVEGRSAVDVTGGVVVTYLAAPARVVFSSCCGGQTADSADVWNTPYPYLKSVADPHCAGTPSFAWQTELSPAVLQSAFGARLSAAGSLRAVQLRAPATGDRPRGVDFIGAAATFELSPNALRTALGPSVIRSTFVRQAVLAKGGALALSGTGRGHGVGLCQWGARVMADEGASAQEIVAFYFPGTAFGRG